MLQVLGGKDSLKVKAIKMGWHLIQDLPYPPNSKVTEEQARVIYKYCQNDVLITLELFKRYEKEILIRLELEKFYKVQGLTCKTNPGIAEALFKKVLKIKKNSGFSVETKSEEIILSELIPVDFCFENSVLKQFLLELRQIRGDIKSVCKKIKRQITIDNITFKIGVG